MEDYVTTLKKNVEMQRSQQRHTKQRVQLEMKTYFRFDPEDSLYNQIKKFQVLKEKQQWNGNLRFCNFFGKFKIEFWIQIEKYLRYGEQLKKIKFTKSKLGAQHLNILLNLLVWLQPTSIEIELNHNELDDLNLQEFTIKLINSKINLKYLIISNNPGIERGKYIEQISLLLEKQMTFNLNFNSQFKSMILYNKKTIDEKTYSYIQKKLRRLIYHSLNFSNCFTLNNYQAFEFLITTCFNESVLESIIELNLSNNFLGPTTLVENLFRSMAFSKGLLKLGLSNLSILTSQTCQQLIGNRYSQLRLLELDLSNNPDLEESALQILLEKILTNSCKQFQLENTFIKNQSLQTKLYLFSQAFRDRIKLNENINLIKLDLSQFENKYESVQLKINNQQNDLIEDVLKFSVLNHLSNIQQLILNNLNDGLCLSYINAISEYQLQSKKSRLLLKEIELKQQNLNISENIFKELLDILLFTKQNKYLEIETIKFGNLSFELDSKCFMFCQYLNSLDTYKDFSLKNIFFINTFATDKLIEKILDVILLSQIFKKIESFVLKENNFNDLIYFDKLMMLCKYITIQPDIKYYPLQSLTLDIVGLQLSAKLFLKCFIHNPQVQLKKIKLANMTFIDNQLDNTTQLKQNEELKLEVIKLINIQDANQNGIRMVISHCLYNDFIDLLFVELSDVPYDIMPDFQFYQLKKLCVYGKFNQFDLPFNIIINSEKLEEIIFKKMDINENMSINLNKYFRIRQQRDSSLTKFQYVINKLQFKECNFKEDILYYFLVDNHCELESLQIIKCKGFENILDEINFKLKKSTDIIRSQLKKITIRNMKLKIKMNQFLEFLKYISFNEEVIDALNLQCQLEELTLQNCELNDEFMMNFIELIQKTIQEGFISKNFLKLIDLSDNNEINFNLWKKFFDLVLGQKQGSIQQRRQNKHNISFSNQLLSIQQNIIKNDLNLQQKLLKNRNYFTPQGPKKIQSIKIRFLTQFENEIEKQQLYQRIVSGLILFPDNNITSLKLIDVDLNLFINSIEKIIDYMKIYQLQRKKGKHQIYNIKKLSISQISLNNEINVFSLCQLFATNLVTLKICDVQNGFIEAFLKYIANFQGKLQITNLELRRIDEFLNQTQSNQFLRDIIFGIKMPLKILKVIESITFKEDNKFVREQIAGIQSQMQRFTFRIENYDSFQYLLSFSKYLLESSQLQQWYIETSQNVSLLFENVDLNSQVPKLNNLHLKSAVDLTPKLLEYIACNSKTLHKINFTSIKISDKKTFQNWCQQAENIELGCQLSTKIDIQNDEESILLIKSILANNIFQWKGLKYKSSFGLKYFDTKNLQKNFVNLQILEVNAGFEQDSNQKIANEFLSYISDKLIYNEESNLKELILTSCNIGVTQIFKLIQEAENYRETQTKKLSLVRFCLNKSKSIDEEAFQELCDCLIFYDFIYLERLELVQMNLSNNMIKKLINSSKNWLKASNQNYFNFKCLNFAFNDNFGSIEVWDQICKMFFFTDYAPNLEALFLNGMNIKNHIAKLIARTANEYFNTKPYNFIYPLQEINFSQNKSISYDGWYQLSHQLFFHPKVNLKDLDITECEINDEEKESHFLRPIYQRVKKQGKLNLVKFRCDNISLKNQFFELNKFSKKGSDKYKSLLNLPFKRQKYGGFGKIEGKIQSFGVLQKNISKALMNYRRIDLSECWNKSNEVKFGCFHLNFVQHFLNILPQIQEQMNDSTDQNKFINEYSFSYFGLDQLFNYFVYPSNDAGQPYPLLGLFSIESQNFFQQSNVSKITIVETFFTTLEKPTQYDIWRIYNNIISQKNNLDLIEIEYTLTDDLIDQFLQHNYTERDIIKFIRVIPPSSIIIKGSLTLQALKGIYSIMYDNNYFQYSHISYDHSRIVNNGIGYSLQSIIYQINVQNKFLIFLKKVLYLILWFINIIFNLYLYLYQMQQNLHFHQKQKNQI